MILVIFDILILNEPIVEQESLNCIKKIFKFSRYIKIFYLKKNPISKAKIHLLKHT